MKAFGLPVVAWEIVDWTLDTVGRLFPEFLATNGNGVALVVRSTR